MKTNIIHYFLSSNGSKGFRSFIPDFLSDYVKTIKLTGYTPEMMSQIYELAQKNAEEMGYPLEVIHNPLDNSIEGLVLPEKKSAIINTPLYLEDDNHIFNLCSCPKRTEINESLSKAHRHFADALKIHDEWEKIYISNLDTTALNELAETTIIKLLCDFQEETEKGVRTDRFLGAATFEGPVDYILNITDNVPKRYFIKGRPGTGKSTFLKKIARQALIQGFDTEIYHCAFDPDSLDLVVIRSLGLCLFDSTAPHEYFPTRNTDEVIDIYDIAVKPNTDENYSAEINNISTRYKKSILSATEHLKNAKILYDEMNKQVVSELNSDACKNNISQIIDDFFD